MVTKEASQIRQGERVTSLSSLHPGEYEWVSFENDDGKCMAVVRKGGTTQIIRLPLDQVSYSIWGIPRRISWSSCSSEPETIKRRRSQMQGGGGASHQQQQATGSGTSSSSSVPLRDPFYIQRKRLQNRVLLQHIKKLSKPIHQVHLLALDDLDQEGKFPRTMTAFLQQGGLAQNYYSPNIQKQAVVEKIKEMGGHSQKTSLGKYLGRMLQQHKMFDALYFDYCCSFHGDKTKKEERGSPLDDINLLFSNSQHLLQDKFVFHLSIYIARGCQLTEVERFAIINMIFSQTHFSYRGRVTLFQQWESKTMWKINFVIEKVSDLS